MYSMCMIQIKVSFETKYLTYYLRFLMKQGSSIEFLITNVLGLIKDV